MATILIEQVDSRQLSEEVKTGRRSVRRTFKAPNIRSEEQVRTAFFDEGHEVYPPDPTLELVGVSLSPMPSGAGFVVQSDYASKSTSRFSPPRDDPNYYHFGWSTQDVKVKLPFSQLTRLIINDDQPAVEVWALREVEYVETRLIRPFRVRVTNWTYADLDAIAVEKRKIHSIYGADYLYLGGDVEEVDGEAIDITHSWQVDKGTPYANENNRSRIDVSYPIVSTGVPELMRLPYTETIAIPPSDPRNNPFGAVPFYPYARSNDGWRRLPGTGLL